MGIGQRGRGAGRDIDEGHAERFLEKRLADALERAAPRRPIPRRPGAGPSTPQEEDEQAADPEAKPAKLPEEPATADGTGRSPRDQSGDESEATAGQLAFADDQRRARTARVMGFDQRPGPGDAVLALLAADDARADEDLAPLLPSAAARGHPDLPEAEIRPPDFLSPREAMKDIYLRVKGRASPRTRELLEGPRLEDLLELLARPFQASAPNPEAKIAPPLRKQLGDDPGPLLIGFCDPRLTEPWRLWLEGWDLWVPDGHDDGIELFWEGEAEDDDGEPMVVLQTLGWVDGEASLRTRIGALEDDLTYDGEGFYRLRTERPVPRRRP